MSNAPVSRRKWIFALAGLTLIALIGATLAIALALGEADPTRAPTQTLDTTEVVSSSPLPAPPYTIEVRATDNGEDSVWGIWIGADASHAMIFLIDHQGYMSIAPSAERDWAQFIHLKPQTNALYLNVESGGSATFRINGEIAWQGSVPSAAHWGISAPDRQPNLTDFRAEVYEST